MAPFALSSGRSVTVRAFEDTGLRVARVEDLAGIAADHGGAAHERPHVVRIDAAGHEWAELRAAGAIVRPAWVHWACPVAGGSADVMARQGPKQRQRTRLGLRALDGMSMQLSRPVDPATFADWLPLYATQVEAMQHGRNLASIFRKAILGPDSPYLLAVWRRDCRIVCGSVVEVDAERDALMFRYSAVAPVAKRAELTRAMLVAFADVAAAEGCRWITLGNDVNFYGAIVRPGLAAFKLRLGFHAVPADLFGRAVQDVAERIVSLDGLEQPVLLFERRRPRDPCATLADYLTGAHALGLVAVVGPGATSEVLELLPDHRRLVLAD